MDCGLFSTKALLETNPSQNIEIKNQLRPDSITMDSKQSWILLYQNRILKIDPNHGLWI